MRKLVCCFLVLLLACPLAFANALAESTSPVEYLRDAGYTLYEVDSLEDFGIDPSLFESDNAALSFCGCMRSSESHNYAYFGRESNGHLFIAHTGATHALLDAFSPGLTQVGMLTTFVEICEACDVDLAFMIDAAGFRFGFSSDTEQLKTLALNLSEGMPRTTVVGWENYRRLLMFG